VPRLPARLIRPILAVLRAVPLAVVLGAPEAPKRPVKGCSKTTFCQVLRVVDGETGVVQRNGKGTTVRLIGVDAPETVHLSKPVPFYGKEAGRFLINQRVTVFRSSTKGAWSCPRSRSTSSRRRRTA
jgi:endonuclease YncB( thermonuclease family)